jgi:hypothetical protein
VKIDAIEKRTGNPREIPLDQRRSARAFPKLVTIETALAQLRCHVAGWP